MEWAGQIQQQIPLIIGCVDEKESACGMWQLWQQYTGIPGRIDIQIIIDAIISVKIHENEFFFLTFGQILVAVTV